MRYKLSCAWANKKRYWILPASFYYKNFFKVHWSCAVILRGHFPKMTTLNKMHGFFPSDWELHLSGGQAGTVTLGQVRWIGPELWIWTLAPVMVKAMSTWLGHGMPRHKCNFRVSVRVFLGGINFWIDRLSKADCPSQCGWASSNHLTAWLLRLPDCWAGTVVLSSLWTWTETSALLGSWAYQV